MEEAIYEGRKLRKGRDGRMKGNKAGRKDETNEHKKKKSEDGRKEGEVEERKERRKEKGKVFQQNLQ